MDNCNCQFWRDRRNSSTRVPSQRKHSPNEGRLPAVEFTELQSNRYRQLVIDYLQRSRTSYVAATTAGHQGQAEMAATNLARELSRSSRAREVWESAGRQISLTIDATFVSVVERKMQEFEDS